MIIEIKNVEGLNIPSRANETDAGYDIIATSEPNIVGEKEGEFWKSISYIEYKTNTFISPQSNILDTTTKNYHTLLFPRSSISKYNLSLSNSVGLVDQGYKNEILFRFNYLFQPEDYKVWYEGQLVAKVNYNKIYKIGDKIGQLVITETIQPEFKIVNELKDTDRGNNGFGSSGS